MALSFTNFSGTSSNRAIDLSWNIISSLPIVRFCVNYSDNLLEEKTVQNTSIPINLNNHLVSGNLYNYKLSGLINGGVNGNGYMVSLEATLSDNSIVNSNTIVVIPSTVPLAPNYFNLANIYLSSFTINLSDNGVTKYNSIYDGFSRLTKAYVIYNDHVSLKTAIFLNDASNSLYTRNLTVNGIPNGLYEVSVSLVNKNGDSQLSVSKTINVDEPAPGAVTDVTVDPTMFVDPLFDFQSNSMTVSWNPPSFLGDPVLNQYEIKRSENHYLTSLDASLNNISTFITLTTINAFDQNNNLVTKYVDNTVQAGWIYSYIIVSKSSSTGLVLPNESLPSPLKRAVASKPTITDLSLDTIDNRQIKFTLGQWLGFWDSRWGYQFTWRYDISGNNELNNRNPLFNGNDFKTDFTLDNLDNGISYTFQMKITISTTYKGNNFIFETPYSDTLTSVPYGSLSDPTNFIVKNVDAVDGIPLNQKLDLTWIDPTNESYGIIDFSFNIDIYRDDGNGYLWLTSIQPGVQRYQDISLNNGTLYRYKLKQKMYNQYLGGYLYSSGVEASAIPFFYPDVPSGLSFTDASMEYSFNPVINTGGLHIAGYELTLTNLTDISQNVQIIDLSSNNTSGDLLINVESGKYYSLTVKSYVVNDGVRIYSPDSSPVRAYSKPDTPNAPTVYNVDSNNVPLNGKLNIYWERPNGLDSSARFSLLRNGNVIPSASALNVTNYQDASLNNGTSYVYEVKIDLGSISSDLSLPSNSVVPFTYPDVPSGLLFTDASMAHSFNPVTNTGGLPIAGYVLTLTNLTDISQNVQIIELSSDDTSGNLLDKVSPGKKYSLTVKSYVDNNGVEVYSSDSLSQTAYSKPAAPVRAPTVYNVDSNNVPLDGKLNISWDPLAAGVDSSATFSLLRDEVFIASGLTATSYQDTGLVNGTSYVYQVQIDLGSTSSDLSPSSNSVVPFAYPGPVTHLQYQVVDSSHVYLEWVLPTVNGGVYNWTEDIVYKVVDSSNITVPSGVWVTGPDTFFDIYLLNPGVAGMVYVQVGVKNVAVGPNITLNDTLYVPLSLSNSIEVEAHALPGIAQNVLAYPNDGKVAVTSDAPAAVAGLTFYGYEYAYKQSLDVNYNSTISQSTQPINISNLMNNVQHTVSLVLVYKTANSQLNLIRSAPVTVDFTPQIPPNLAQSLSFDSISSTEGILSWDVDNSVNSATHYTVIVDSSNNSRIIEHIEASSNNSILSTIRNRWLLNISQLVSGTIYTFTIVSERLIADPVYVSSQLTSILGTTISSPSAVRSLNYTPDNNSVNLSWDVPELTSGAGLPNGNMEYAVTLYNPNNSNYKNISVTSDLSFNLSGTITTTDGSNNLSINITNLVQYIVEVRPQFAIKGNQNNLSVGEVSQIIVQPRQNQMTPVLTAEAINKNGDGKRVKLTLTIDPSSNTSNVEVYVSRIIKDSSNNVLAPILSHRLFLNFDTIDTNMTASFEDGDVNSVITDDRINFLNGNVIYYTATVKQNGWTINKQNVSQSSEKSVVPSGKAIIENLTIDASGNLSATVNKNGSIVNSLILLGFDNDNNNVQVIQVVVNTLDFTSASVSGTAKDQKAVYTVARGNWNSQIEQALAVFATQNSTALKDFPAGSFLK